MIRTLNIVLNDGRRRLAVLGAMQVLCAFFEAATIALLIPFLAAVGSAQSQVDLSAVVRFGSPTAMPTSTTAAMLIGAVLCRTVTQIAAAWYWSRSVFHFEHQRR